MLQPEAMNETNFGNVWLQSRHRQSPQHFLHFLSAHPQSWIQIINDNVEINKTANRASTVHSHQILLSYDLLLV
jgi:hypothetical protein